MIGHANEVPRDTTLEADVCVVGAGAAGIPLALTLVEQGLRVLLLEAGERTRDAAAQQHYAGEVADERMHSPPDRYRVRGLGGSTSLWGGRCMPYDPIDFETRDWVPGSGWPISHAGLLPYYARANAWAEAGRCAYDARTALPDAAPLIRGFDSPVVGTHSLERFSCPTDFGRRYRDRLEVAPGLRVLQGAHVTAVRLRADGSAVRVLEVRSARGNRFSVRARAHVLAQGGLETPRLLLASNDVQPAGVGNAHDVVGRYYQCHLAANVGSLEVFGPVDAVRHGYELAPEGVYCRRRIQVDAGEQRRRQLLNTVARLHFPHITDPAHGIGVLSGLVLAKGFVGYEYGKRLRDQRLTPALAARHLWNVLADPVDTTRFLAHWVGKRTLAQRKFPSVILNNRRNRFSLEVQAEQQPLRSSRVALASAHDAFGLPRLRVDWRCSQADIASVGRTLELIAGELQRTGVGRLTWDRESLGEELLRYGAYGGHHIGTTRMGTDPRTSVVDADCKVHGIADLYVAGSAVFPTSSQANPTLTIVALALRLADRLATRLQTRRAPAQEVAA